MLSAFISPNEPAQPTANPPSNPPGKTKHISTNMQEFQPIDMHLYQDHKAPILSHIVASVAIPVANKCVFMDVETMAGADQARDNHTVLLKSRRGRWKLSLLTKDW